MMTAGSPRHDEDRPGDALDQVIDDAIGSALGAETVDLRERVLARLDEPAEAPSAWLRFVLRPALLPAAGAVLLAVGVLLTWQHVDGTLARIGARRSASRVADARPGPPPAGQEARATPLKPPSSPAATPAPPSAVAGVVRPAHAPTIRAAAERVAVASMLELDATSATRPVGAATVIGADDVAAAGQPVPGAMGGDLGDPITPIPPIRPIAIAPIVVAPLVEAPPVSTLSQPSAPVPTVGEISRDPSGPGKSGGDRP